MQLMTFNSLLMFDIVFIFFLFLVAVTCLMYYLPPTKIKRKSHFDSRRSQHQQSITVASSNSSKSVLFINGDSEQVESFTKCCKYCEKCKLIYEEIYSERSYDISSSTASAATAAVAAFKSSVASSSSSNSSYLKAKECDIKNCKGPIYEV